MTHPIEYTEDHEKWLSTCVALLRAGQEADYERLSQIVDSLQPGDLAQVLMQMTGIANRIGYTLHGRQRFAELVASRQPGQGIPGVHRPPTSGHAQLN